MPVCERMQHFLSMFNVLLACILLCAAFVDSLQKFCMGQSLKPWKIVRYTFMHFPIIM